MHHTSTVETGLGPPYGVVAGVVAAVLGIEFVAFGLTGRRFP